MERFIVGSARSRFVFAASTINYIFTDANIKAAFFDDANAALLPKGSYLRIGFDDPSPAGFANFLRPGTFEPAVPTAESLAKLLYTSGSTGQPKGVMLGHVGQVWALNKILKAWFPTPGTVSQIVAPTYHKNGLFNTMSCLAGGATIVSLPRFNAKTFLQAINDHRSTAASGIPTMFAMIAQEADLIKNLDLKSMQSVVIGSAPLTQALIERVRAIFPNAAVSNGYGTTESGAVVFGAHPDGVERPSLCIGYPFDDIGWELRDGPDANEGVFFMRTPAMMEGYLNLPGVTSDKLQDGWYNTGDVMRRDEKGFFYFVGRADDMFVCGGENVYPGEVEKLLESHAAVVQVAVVPAPDDIKGAIPVAYVVVKPGSSLSESELKEYYFKRGPAYSHPRFIVFTKEIPVAGTHKVDRKKLMSEAKQLAQSRGRSTAGGLT
jgi:long-chain acyl-CoA synthetase